MSDSRDPLASFIEAACVPLDAGHASGNLERAEAILSDHSELASTSIHAAAILGDAAAVRRFLRLDPGNATVKGGPRGWDALTHLCFSRYLRLDRSRSENFVRSAAALIDAGASANTGFHSGDEFEAAIYGAAGVAHHPELTRLLIERGADANDGETIYHTPESYDNSTLKVLVESGKLTDDSLATMLLRKSDWHDFDGIKWLLEHGADPKRMTRWGKTAIHQALLRDNALEIFELLLDHGANPTLVTKYPSPSGKSLVALAARAGRGDVLDLFEQRRISIELEGVDQLLAACARNDAAGVGSFIERRPDIVREVIADGGELLAEFAGIGNTLGVRHLLDLGVGVMSRFEEGDGYFDIARESTALHVAAWRAQHTTLRLLIERGAEVNSLDGRGRSPLMLAVRACVDSYWTYRRSPESVKALLDAGASIEGVALPSGYDEVDELIDRVRRQQLEG